MDVEDPLVDIEIEYGEYTTDGRVMTRRYTILDIGKGTETSTCKQLPYIAT